MSKLGLLQQYGPCNCENPNLHQLDHQEVENDKNDDPKGSNSVTDYRCHDCGGVQFQR